MNRFTGAYPATLPGGQVGYQDYNGSTGMSGSLPNAEAQNNFQESLMAIQEGAGVGAAPGAWTQTMQAIKRIAGGNFTTISASATLTADMAGLVVVNAAGGNVVLTLPAANAANGVGVNAGTNTPLKFTFYRTDTSSHTVSFAAPTGNSIAPASLSLAPQATLEISSDANLTWVALNQALFTTVNVTTAGARLLNTNYTNSTGRPMLLLANIGNTSGFNANGWLNGTNIIAGVTAAAGTGSQVIMIVPAGWYYQVTVSAGSGSVVSWVEIS